MAFSPARIEALRLSMAAENIDILYVRGLSNIVWATGFERVFDTESAHALVVTADTVGLHSDSRYAEALLSAAESTPIAIDVERKTHRSYLLEFVEAPSNSVESDRPSAVRIGIEDSLTLAEFRPLECQCAPLGVELVELSDFVEHLRERKDAAEVEAMRRAQQITDAAFARIVECLRPGMTEREAQIMLDGFMREEGAEGLAFDTIVATGAHAASPHAIPGEDVLRPGDAVVMDFGARWAGYCSDMTRTVFIGEPSEELRHAWEALRRANEACEARLRAGECASDVHQLAEDILAEAGFAGCMGHALGHSVGIDIHEAPALSSSNDAPLEAGNVVTVEPGIYISGSFGMRLEDFGVVTEDGYEVFTQSTHDMVIIENC